MTGGSASFNDVLALAESVFSETEPRYGPFEFASTGHAEIVADLLYRFEVTAAGSTRLSLHVFRDIDRDLSGALWDNEVRTLLRVSRLGHQALPELHSGGYDTENRLAWVATPSAPDDLNDPRAVPAIQANPRYAVRQLVSLADALATLHGQGIVHRNLWPGTILLRQVDNKPDHELPFELQLGRFETTSILSSLLRYSADPTGRANATFRLLRTQGNPPGDALRYFAPERVEGLLGLGEVELADTERADVFALGATASEWFLGPMPVAEHLTHDAEGHERADQIRSLQDAIRTELRTAPAPAPLAKLIAWMLSPDPRSRPSSAEVADELVQNYDALTGAFEGDRGDRPLLVSFLPEQSENTLHRWNLACLDPSTPAGRDEIKEVIERDLRRASLVYSPRGAEDYVGVDQADPTERRTARWVLLGKQVAWFCHPGRPRDAFGALGEAYDDVLLIKHPVRLSHRLRTRLGAVGARSSLRRAIPSVEAEPWDARGGAQFEDVRRDRPKWTPLLESVAAPEEPEGEEDVFLDALDWLLQLQGAELMLREYPYHRPAPPERRGASQSEVWAELVFDRDRDRGWTRGNDLYALLEHRREGELAFGFFLESDAAAGSSGTLEFKADDNGRPSRVLGEVIRVHRKDANTIDVMLRPGSPALPERGWIRPADDRAQAVSLHRQRAALGELRDQRGLLGQLHSPHSVTTSPRRWVDAGRGLLNGVDRTVGQILATEPFFALHGPPGTGKTTVVAHAVSSFLAAEPSARVLVSAQANDALDNLALRILEQCAEKGVYVTPLRVGRQTDRMHSDIQQYRLDQAAQTLLGTARARTRRRLERGTDPPAVTAVLAAWRSVLDGAALEVRERLHRGANLVFATCNGSNPESLGTGGPFAVFDWVVVEEAAKAWPTELVIPLVRGVRWTLVGDHRQLPAFRRREVSRVLKACSHPGTVIDELRKAGERRKEYENAFDLFTRFFDEPDRRPVAQLVWQFRMRDPIASVVSRAFYEAENDPALRTPARNEVDSGLTRPSYLKGAALVWIDTAGDPECVQEPQWRNPGEARLIARLLRDAGLLAEPPGQERLAILTPWHHQRRCIEDEIGSEFASRVHTVDSFQGREADIVVCSLVRDKKSSGGQPHDRLGHLSDPQRVNVMLSRAKRLNVIVGNFEHFRSSDLDFWEIVCDTVRERGRVVTSTARESDS